MKGIKKFKNGQKGYKKEKKEREKGDRQTESQGEIDYAVYPDKAM